ncbi:unnamed protein product [Chondrus crispus]|uniref:WW domain-containing protein n=1 Tax=Chondrus crispus TaxID=2769 RepID=R7QSU0_CHOCR|nr:unnamed protein product [Chondrus crispus]CDF40808.1 unnamed protein product [Chondrus crispus]|eukprot:XP_005711102.1 unnamed protein product [Chondrus crispus]
MNGHPRQQPKHLPYSQCNRVWVTAQNEHLCPSKPRTTQAAASQPVQGTSKLTAFPSSALKSAPPGNSTDRSTNASNTSKYRELEAPKSLGLTADEILMQAEGGRRYIYNKKTKNSRWLDRPSEKISADQKNASIKNGSSKLSSFPYAPERKERGTFTSDSNPTLKAASSHASESQSWQAFSHERNGSAHQRTNSQTRGTANGYVHRSKPLSADEAALSIQRAFRASVVRRGNLVDKWRLITKVLDEVSDTISKGKYDIDYLRGLPNRSLNGEERGHAMK